MSDEILIKQAVGFARGISDLEPDALQHTAERFVEAHRGPARGKLTVEIGTRSGGSALLFLYLLDVLYDDEDEDVKPMLFTVDPYGYRPYESDYNAAPLYGDLDYRRMKQLLSHYTNHVHWYMEGLEFLTRMGHCPYWHRGSKQFIDEFAFVFLDGDHVPEVVWREIDAAWLHLAEGGILLVDNADQAKMPIGHQKTLSSVQYVIQKG